MSSPCARVVVVGTGTEIGKTHVSCCLLSAAHAREHGWIGLKPIETGVDPGAPVGEDGARLWQSAGMFHVKPSAAPFRYLPPVSPHLAARAAGERLDVARVRAWVDQVSAGRPALIETAGGWFSPLGDGLTNYDLTLALAPSRIVLVAPDRLGVLHDLTATLGYARSRGRLPDVVALSAPSAPDTSTETNARELDALGIVSVVATFPRGAVDDARSAEAARRVWQTLEA